MPALALSPRSSTQTGFGCASPAPRIDSWIPKATIFHVSNPGEPWKSFIVAAPKIWGPYDTCQELQEAYDELRVLGDIQ